ncbi:MAG: hypothetical protein PUP92_22130 [Rhizonema sp. PD38]|nr:hypothetical protein [Rhizonema sp. PD38]
MKVPFCPNISQPLLQALSRVQVHGRNSHKHDHTLDCLPWNGICGLPALLSSELSRKLFVIPYTLGKTKLKVERSSGAFW